MKRNKRTLKVCEQSGYRYKPTPALMLIWYIHNPEYRGKGACIIFHKHRASHPYHQHGKARNLQEAIRRVKKHDVFQMNGRK